MIKIKLLLLILLFGAIPNFLWAYTKDQIVSFDGDQTHYQVIQPDGEAGKTPTLRYIATKVKGALVIPETVSDGKGVTFTVVATGYVPGYNNYDVTSIKLPSTVKTIGSYSFYNVKELIEIEIPATVEKIENLGWLGPRKNPIYKVDPNNPNYCSDNDGALYTKDKGELFSVPSNIGVKVANKTYNVNESVTKIYNGAFDTDMDLTKIVLPKNLQEVVTEHPSIVSTNSLEKFEMPEGGNTKFKVVDGVLFNKEKNSLICFPRNHPTTEYTVPADITSIAQYSILANRNLTSFKFNKVKDVGWNAIASAHKLKTITISPTLTQTGLAKGAIAECKALEKYEVENGNPDFVAEDGVLFSKDKKQLYFYPPAKEGTTYTIPASVETVKAKAFQGALKITSVTVPTNVKTIESDAFRNMENVLTVDFTKPSSTTEINGNAFWGCKKLKTATLPSEITTLRQIFTDCLELETVNVPNGSKIKEIVNDAFGTNKKLKKINFEGTCDLETIGTNAFANAVELESFDFPKSIKEIKRNAFSGCSKMATVKFDEDAAIEKIGAGAFADCGLTTISIPKKVKAIEREACRNCKALKVINVEQYTETIHPEAFKYCDNLTDINIHKENTKYSSIDGYLLSPDKKTLILFPPGKANSKFTLLPPSIEKIGDNSFFNCEKLTNVTIPNKVKEIGYRAFGLCKNLKTITFLCDKMIDPSMINQAQNEMSFDDGTQAPNMFDHITINVRKELYDQYANTPFYKNFKGGVNKSFEVGKEEYIAMSDNSVNMLKTKREDHTFVLPTKIQHGGKDYEVNLIGDYAFEGVNNKIKEVVVKKNVEYIGAKAFVTNKDKNNLQSTVESVFFIESEPTAKMLSTTRFELDETQENYNEFAPTTKVYVKKSALEKYTKEWNKKVYDRDIHDYKVSPFNFIGQIDYKIPAKDFITNKYGTFAREFDTDFSAYKAENHNTEVAAFVSKIEDIKRGQGDYGNAPYLVRMTSVDVNGGVSGHYGYVPANTGVLLKVLDKDATPADFFYTIGEKDDKEYTINNNVMHGITVNPRSVSPTEKGGPVYVIAKKKGIFEKLTQPVQFPIHKAYALLGNIPAGAKVMFSFSDDDSSTTGIMSVDAEKPADNIYYNLNGQRVTTPQRGIYIQNGRKVIVK